MTFQPSLQEIIESIQPLDQIWLERAKERTERLVMPPRALGRLLDMAERCCAIGRTLNPVLDAKGVLVMAGDHGIAQEGVSAFPQAVTTLMVRTFLAGGAAINALARHVGAQVRVVDMGIVEPVEAGDAPGSRILLSSRIGAGTGNFARGQAMTRAQAEASVMAGFRHAAGMFESGIQAIATGDMGIANTTASSAIGVVLTGAGLEEMVGRGTGVDDAGLARKREAVAAGLRVNSPDPRDGLDVLAKVGGFEIGGIAGVVLAGAFFRRPVVVDGFISTAGALIAQALCPLATEYLFAGHQSEEPGHARMLRRLGLQPVLNLGMRLGEGTGAVMAMSVIEGALKAFTEMMTFEQAGIPV